MTVRFLLSRSRKTGLLTPLVIDAHAIGVNAACWAPVAFEDDEDGEESNDGNKGPKEIRRFVTAGADNLVKVWRINTEHRPTYWKAALEGHTDWVRDVAWSPSVLLRSYIASVSQTGPVSSGPKRTTKVHGRRLCCRMRSFQTCYGEPAGLSLGTSWLSQVVTTRSRYGRRIWKASGSLLGRFSSELEEGENLVVSNLFSGVDIYIYVYA